MTLVNARAAFEKAVTDAVVAADNTVSVVYDNVTFVTPGKAKKDSWNKDSVKSKDTTYKIQPRFPVDKTFNIKRSVFIGSKAKYAAYALETGKVQFFVQGELGRLIQETMTSKGRIFVASKKTGGFGSFEGGVGYTEF